MGGEAVQITRPLVSKTGGHFSETAFDQTAIDRSGGQQKPCTAPGPSLGIRGFDGIQEMPWSPQVGNCQMSNVKTTAVAEGLL